MPNNEKEAAASKQLVIFVLVGLLTAIIYIGLFQMLTKVAGVYTVVAISIAFTIATAIHYVLSKRCTFDYGQIEKPSSVFRYLTTSLIALLVQISVIQLLTLGFRVGLDLAVLVAAATVPALSFALLKLWVFRKP
jgi:putative flippase GtrA